jgi:predicted TPR repeat methyltransferase
VPPQGLQPVEELEESYKTPDPWNYDATVDDQIRRTRLLGLLPQIRYRRVLDIGCGNGFVTAHLPGDSILGCDISVNAVHWARERIRTRSDASRFAFGARSIFDLDAKAMGRFDLIIITGVLYPQYIGNAFSVVTQIVDSLLLDDGILAACHISDWSRWRFPYTLLLTDIYQYLKYSHRIEIFVK